MTDERDIQTWRSKESESEEGGEFVAAAPAMRRTLKRLEHAAETDLPILLQGETGTGKSMFAKWIHDRSQRSGGPFIGVNCAAITETLSESELFGHERGAFTDAKETRIGQFEAADQGTLLLDEIGDAPLSVQVKLLRVLQERVFERVGGAGQTLSATARIIAATNQDLCAGIENGSFRKDLYYRLNTVAFEIPPLRERREDIPPLISMFEKKHAYGGKPVQFSPDAMDALLKYSYPGNVRELDSVIAGASIAAKDSVIHVRHLPEEMRRSGGGETPPPQSLDQNEDGGAQISLPDAVEQLERTMIERQLRATGGVQAQAAKRLGITERMLQTRIKKYGIEPSEYSSDE